MDVYQFDQFKIKENTLFNFMNEKGEVWSGTFIGKVGDDKFQFNNFSNGKVETIEIRKLQFLTIMKRPEF